jgi:hypothetical protein
MRLALALARSPSLGHRPLRPLAPPPQWTRNEPRVDTVLHCSLNDDPGSPARRRAPPRSPLFSRANSVGESEAAEPFRTRQSSLAPSRERTPSQARRELLPLPVADDQPQPFSADGEGEPRRVPPPPAAPAAPASPLAPPRPHAKAAQGAEARAAQVTRKLLSAPTLVDDWPAAQPRARAGTEGAAASTPPGGADGAPPPAAPAFGSVEPGSSSSASPQPSSQPAQPWSQPHHLDRCAAEHTAAAGGGADGGGGGSSSVGSSASAPRSPAQRERMLPLRTTLDLHQPLHGSPAAHVHSPQLHGAGSLAPIGQRQRSWGALNALSQLHGAPAVNSAALRPSRLPSTASELGALGGSGADSPASSAAQLDAAPAAPFRAISPTSPAAAGALRDELRVTRAELERTQQALQRAERARLELRAQCGELRAQLRAALPQPAAAADGTLASSVAARLVLAAVSLACALLAFLVGLVEGFLVGVVQGMLRVWDRGNRQELHSLMVGLVVSVLITRALV